MIILARQGRIDSLAFVNNDAESPQKQFDPFICANPYARLAVSLGLSLFLSPKISATAQKWLVRIYAHYARLFHLAAGCLLLLVGLVDLVSD